MKKILITGATGNIGFEVIRFLLKMESPNQIIAGVRNIEKAKQIFTDYPKIDFVNFNVKGYKIKLHNKQFSFF